MTITVDIEDAQAFFARHATSQAELEASAPEQTMRARLRPYYPMLCGRNDEIFSVSLDGRVVAVSQCFSETASRYQLSYVSVDADYRKRGLATQIVQKIVSTARDRGFKAIESSYYTELGVSYLQHILRREASEGIALYEDGKLYRAPRRTP